LLELQSISTAVWITLSCEFRELATDSKIEGTVAGTTVDEDSTAINSVIALVDVDGG
jgi:hypothetical protein